jgi:hypothetical protein
LIVVCHLTGNVPAVEMLLQGWKENKWGLRDKLDLNAEDPNAAGSTPLHAAIFSTSALAHKNVRVPLCSLHIPRIFIELGFLPFHLVCRSLRCLMLAWTPRRGFTTVRSLSTYSPGCMGSTCTALKLTVFSWEQTMVESR